MKHFLFILLSTLVLVSCSDPVVECESFQLERGKEYTAKFNGQVGASIYRTEKVWIIVDGEEVIKTSSSVRWNVRRGQVFKFDYTTASGDHGGTGQFICEGDK